MKDKLVVILMGAMILFMIGFSIMFYVMWTKISILTGQKHDGKKISEKAEEKKLGPVFSLDTFIVNLDDPKYRKYLRVTMDLELDDEKSSEKIVQRLPQIRDSVLKILPSNFYEEVITAAGKNALRDKILKELNSLFSKKMITNIYFTEFVMQ